MRGSLDEVGILYCSLEEGGLFNSKADVSWGGGNNWGGVKGSAVGGFVWAGVVVADVFQKTISDLVLDGSIVLVVDSNPWDPLVSWGEGFGLDGDGVLHGDGI